MKIGGFINFPEIGEFMNFVKIEGNMQNASLTSGGMDALAHDSAIDSYLKTANCMAKS